LRFRSRPSRPVTRERRRPKAKEHSHPDLCEFQLDRYVLPTNLPTKLPTAKKRNRQPVENHRSQNAVIGPSVLSAYQECGRLRTVAFILSHMTEKVDFTQFRSHDFGAGDMASAHDRLAPDHCCILSYFSPGEIGIPIGSTSYSI
jgi:hypothetical protein